MTDAVSPIWENDNQKYDINCLNSMVIEIAF